jgi:hypothetical protein
MIYAKEKPIGIDAQILKFQQKLESLGWSNAAVYGRLYLNERRGLSIAEAYTSNGQYSEVFIDDKRNATFGFIVSGNREGLSFVNSNVKLICSVNLERLYITSERMDEECMLSVISAISPLLLSDNEGEIITNMEDVFSGISTERFKHRNMHPWLNFALTFNVSYLNGLCNLGTNRKLI